MGNFSFLQSRWPMLSHLGEMAEQHLYNDSNASIIKLRMFGEQMTDYIFAYDNLEASCEDNQFNRLKIMEREGFIEGEIRDIFHSLRKTGNLAVHEIFSSTEEAETMLRMVHKLGIWFMQVYGDYDYEPDEFATPLRIAHVNQEVIDTLTKAYEERLERIQQELIEIKGDHFTNKSRKTKTIYLNEDEKKKLAADRELEEDLVELHTDNRRFITTQPVDNREKKRVWNAVKYSLRKRSCLAYWHYPFFTSKGEVSKEPDILIADPFWGLILIEIRGISMDDLEISGDDWNLKEGRGKYGRPLEEAEDMLFALLGLCDGERVLRRRIQGRSIVALPCVQRGEWLARGFLPEGVIFGDELGKKGLLEALERAEPKVVGKALDDEQWSILLSVLTGQVSFREKGAKQGKITTRGGVKSYIQEHLHRADLKQEEIGKTIPPGAQRIRGIAGSGKTVLLCQKAALMHLKYPEWNIALVFFTRSLYGNTIQEVDRWLKRFSNGKRSYDAQARRKLMVLHAWGAKDRRGFYREVCLHNDVEPLAVNRISGGLAPNEKLVLACKLLLERRDPLKPLFDAVLIDEAQDLVVDKDELKYKDKQPFFWVAYGSLKNVDEKGERRLIWAYDEAQTLNSLKIPSAQELLGQAPLFRRLVSGFHEGGIRKSEIMSRCYRTPGPILVSAHAMGMGLLRKEGILTGFTTKEDWENIGYRVLSGSFHPVGQRVVLHRPKETTPNVVPKIWKKDLITFRVFSSRKEELEAVASSIKHNIEEDGLEPSRDILVIVLGDTMDAYWSMQSAGKALMEMGIDVYIPSALTKNIIEPKYPHKDPNRFWYEGAVTVTSIFRAKGHEAFMVYVIGLDEIGKREADFALRNQLFVALTRTKAWLHVSGIKEYAIYDEYRRVLESGDTLEFTFQRPLFREEKGQLRR